MSEELPLPTAVVGRLQSLLLSTEDVVEFLEQLAVLCTEVVPGHQVSCGVTLRREGNFFTVASSDARAGHLDESQYQSNQGPCLQAVRTGQQVHSRDLDLEQRWPEYTAVARRHGLRCSVSLPLAAAGSRFGAMNVYGFEVPNLFGEIERHQYQLFAAQAAGALRLATRQARDTALLVQLEEALNSRSVIDQAIGVLIARHQLTGTQAFDLLRRQSQTTQRKLRDLAADLVEQAGGAPPTPSNPFDTA